MTDKKQLLHLVMGGRVTDPQTMQFQDLNAIEVVGIFPDYPTALEAWRGGEGRIELVDVQSKPDSAKGRVMLDGTHALDGTFSREMFGLTKLESAPLY